MPVEGPTTLGTEAELRPLKPLIPMGSSPSLWPLALLVALVALSVLAWRWRRRGFRAPRVKAAPPAPQAEALIALEHLASRYEAGEHAAREVYFELSSIVRRYVEARFGLNATDLTTEEILVELGSVAGISLESAMQLRTILHETDAVKFAARMPSSEETAQALARARRLVAAAEASAQLSERAA